MLYVHQLFANKPASQASWKLTICVEPLILNNNSNAAKQAIFKNWKLLVSLAGAVVFDNAVDHKVTVTQYIADSTEVTRQELKIELLQAPAFVQGQALKLSIAVEDIDITDVLVSQPIYHLADGSTKFGADVMGEVGTQKLLITTPVYRWLFEHEKLLLRQFGP